MKPKVMIGVLGWLARAFCKLEKNVPVEKVSPDQNIALMAC